MPRCRKEYTQQAERLSSERAVCRDGPWLAPGNLFGKPFFKYKTFTRLLGWPAVPKLYTNTHVQVLAEHLLSSCESALWYARGKGRLRRRLPPTGTQSLTGFPEQKHRTHTSHLLVLGGVRCVTLPGSGGYKAASRLHICCLLCQSSLLRCDQSSCWYMPSPMSPSGKSPNMSVVLRTLDTPGTAGARLGGETSSGTLCSGLLHRVVTLPTLFVTMESGGLMEV